MTTEISNAIEFRYSTAQCEKIVGAIEYARKKGRLPEIPGGLTEKLTIRALEVVAIEYLSGKKARPLSHGNRLELCERMSKQALMLQKTAFEALQLCREAIGNVEHVDTDRLRAFISNLVPDLEPAVFPFLYPELKRLAEAAQARNDYERVLVGALAALRLAGRIQEDLSSRRPLYERPFASAEQVRTAYFRGVLSEYLRLGGKLGIAHRAAQEVSGPLWKFFSASVAPVMGIAGETIIEPSSFPEVVYNCRKAIGAGLPAGKKKLTASKSCTRRMQPRKA
jgi:hypothetical protein